MLGFFRPRYVNEAHDLLKSAQKLLDYKRDLWSEAAVAEFQGQMQKLKKAVVLRDEKAVEEEGARLDTLAGKHAPPPNDAGWRENCEVFLVAIVVALGVRTYFLQPFTIPTGSMQPTLNGIIGFPTKSPPPNFAKRIAHALLQGRSYVDVVCEEDGVVKSQQNEKGYPVAATEFTKFYFFTYSRVICGDKTYVIHAPAATLVHDFHVDMGKEYHKGDVIARGYINTGDHVFVDKLTYNFRTPKRGEVFVFNTKGIGTQENVGNPEGPSQFYIKRIGGQPGDELRIESPDLFINGQKATEFGFQRVMAAKNGYRGYSQRQPYMNYLATPDNTYPVPQKYYFALGDNSYNSSDSRYWGVVPQKNIMGKGLFVYWPFNSHWGLIK